METKITIQSVFCFSLFTFSFSLFTFSQTISTVAGNHAFGAGYSGDGGPATAAELFLPTGVGCDASGNFYIADNYNNIIRMVNTSGTISTIAGNGFNFGTGYGGYSGDGGPATAAELYIPSGVGFDVYGNIYIADKGNNIIRKVNTSGSISTVAGNYAFGRGYSGDGGAATAAEINFPYGVALDASGNLYIADAVNNLIRKVNTSGIISTVAGNDALVFGYGGDGGAATAAELDDPYGVGLDGSGNLYIADAGNNVIRKVDSSGTISTVAGNYAYSFPDGGYSGDGGAATAAELSGPTGVIFDGFGNLYIADESNYVIRKVNTSGTISTVAGNGYDAGTGHGDYSGDGGAATSAELYNPSGIALSASGNLYIADLDNNIIRIISGLPTGINAISAEGEGMTIYPNPNNGTFQLQVKSEELRAKSVLEVYNVMGQKVFAETIQPQTHKGALSEIDLSAQPNGIYLYTVLSENGELVGQGKIVVER